jgi:hypothetical protein
MKVGDCILAEILVPVVRNALVRIPASFIYLFVDLFEFESQFWCPLFPLSKLWEVFCFNIAAALSSMSSGYVSHNTVILSCIKYTVDETLLNNVREKQPITVAVRNKTWTLFARSNAGIVGSNPTQGMDVCLRLCAFVLFCMFGSGLATGWSPAPGILPTLYRIKNLKKAAKVEQKGP